MAGCQNYGQNLCPYYNTAPNIKGTQEGTIILTATYIQDAKGSLVDLMPLHGRCCIKMFMLNRARL